MKTMKKYFKGSVTVFVLIMMGMIIGLYLFGVTSPFISAFTNTAEGEASLLDDPSNPKASAGDFLNMIGRAIISAFTENTEVFLAMFGFGLLAGFTGGSYAGGSILRFLIPVMLLFVVINIFIFPVVPAIEGEVTHTEAFSPIIILLTVIFNALLFLTIFSFVSGED